MSVTYGKVKGPGFKPVDVRCPYCAGSGIQPSQGSLMRKWSCILCDGTGARAVATHRILSGEVVRDENGQWIEPDAWIAPDVHPGYPPLSWPGL